MEEQAYFDGSWLGTRFPLLSVPKAPEFECCGGQLWVVENVARFGLVK